jgi:hypothetical protein
MARKSRVNTTSVDAPKDSSSGVAKTLGNAAAALSTTVASRGLDAGWRAVFGEDSPSTKNLKAEDKRRTKDYKASLKLGDDTEKPLPAKDSASDWKIILFSALAAGAVAGAKIAAERGADFLINRRPPLNRG